MAKSRTRSQRRRARSRWRNKGDDCRRSKLQSRLSWSTAMADTVPVPTRNDGSYSPSFYRRHRQ